MESESDMMSGLVARYEDSLEKHTRMAFKGDLIVLEGAYTSFPDFKRDTEYMTLEELTPTERALCFALQYCQAQIKALRDEIVYVEAKMRTMEK